MIRKMIADTPVNDINKGSVLLTLLEAAAANDYENNTAILNVLELLNIDAIRNSDLDAYGSNLGLSRNTASKASGFIAKVHARTVGETAVDLGAGRATKKDVIDPKPVVLRKAQHPVVPP